MPLWVESGYIMIPSGSLRYKTGSYHGGLMVKPLNVNNTLDFNPLSLVTCCIIILKPNYFVFIKASRLKP